MKDVLKRTQLIVRVEKGYVLPVTALLVVNI